MIGNAVIGGVSAAGRASAFAGNNFNNGMRPSFVAGGAYPPAPFSNFPGQNVIAGAVSRSYVAQQPMIGSYGGAMVQSGFNQLGG